MKRKVIDDPALDLDKANCPPFAIHVLNNGDYSKYESSPWEPMGGPYKVSLEAHLINKRIDDSDPGSKEHFAYVTVYEVLKVKLPKATYRFSLGIQTYNLSAQYLSQPHYWLELSSSNLYRILEGYIAKDVLPAWVINHFFKPRGD